MKSEMTGAIQGSGDISSLSIDCVYYYVVYFTNNLTEWLFDILLLQWNMIPQTSSTTLEKGAELNGLTLSDDEDPSPETGSDWAHQPAGFPRIFRKEEFSIRSRVFAKLLFVRNNITGSFLDYKSNCTYFDKPDNSWFVIILCYRYQNIYFLWLPISGIIILLVIIDLKDQNEWNFLLKKHKFKKNKKIHFITFSFPFKASSWREMLFSDYYKLFGINHLAFYVPK